MVARVKLGRVWGIPIGLDPSWFLIFGLLTLSLATGTFPNAFPNGTSVTYWTLGGLTSALFFGSVLAHELAHSFVAIRNRIPVRGITLFFFGGVAQIESEPRSAGTEFRVAIAGPLASLGLAALFWIISHLDSRIPYLAVSSLWLARVNLTLALFNLIPGFPLDGGRVLRSLVWRLTGSYQRASLMAMRAGQLVAYGFMGLGTFVLFTSNLVEGLWYVFIGWFLRNAASSSQARLNLEHSLRGVTVDQVMNRDCPRVPNLQPLTWLVEEQVMGSGHSCFFVTVDGKIRGLLTLRDIAQLPRRKWPYLTAGDVMVPLERLIHIEPSIGILEALKIMESAKVLQVPVVDNNETVGALSVEEVWHYLRRRAEPEA